MSEASTEARRLDRRPFYWMLGIVGVMVIVVLLLETVGFQRLHNTSLWQHFRPVTMVSPPQVATPVEVIDTRRVSHTVVQTEKGLYFLTGARYVPAAGSRVVVQANDRWDLYLCADSGDRCMTIHSFCAEAVWPKVSRDDKGRIEGCHAPRLQEGPAPEPSEVKPLTAVPGGMGKRKRPPPAVGMSHPREWAWLMGLPTLSR